jgi:hypothetical protein
LAVFVFALPGLAQVSTTVQALQKHPDQYDGKVVIVTGNILNYRERVSGRGNPYTTFTLTDQGSVAIFAWQNQGLHAGMRVRVTGTFSKVRHVGQYVFYNEIEASRIETLQAHRHLPRASILVATERLPGGTAPTPLLFHEMVHVVQYALVGIDEFVNRYVRGWLANNQDYFSIPIERQAREYEGRFVSNPTIGFSVEAHTRRMGVPT